MTWLNENENQEFFIGSNKTTIEQAVEWVRPYLEQYKRDPSAKTPYSYPAYDSYPGASGDALGPQDLLAPVLLNAGPTVKAYYTLLRIMDDTNVRLKALDMSFSESAFPTLVDASNSQLDVIADVYGAMDCLNEGDGVRLTTFTKVLHRKRPYLLPLWDKRVKSCYCSGPEEGRRINPPEHYPTYPEFATQWLKAVQRDLKENHKILYEFSKFASQGVPVSQLRVLDIVAWKLG